LFVTGQLNVTNAGGFGPGSYVLFTCAGALDYGNLTLASAPAGYGYHFDTNTPGIVRLVVTQPQIGSFSLTPAGLVIRGSNGPSSGNFYLLNATNLTQPLSAWTRVLTNQFDPNGNFDLTNAINSQSPQSFYRLQMF
jgi:hypothetical protein